MAEWFDVAAVAELPSGSRFVIDAGGTGVVVFNLGGDYFAIEDACPHDGGELAGGRLEGETIVCPRHGARFSVRTGAVLAAPAYQDLQTFPVRVAEGRVQVGIG